MANSFIGKGNRIRGERRDCTVIALAECWDIEYEKAHQICKKAGRKDNQGFNIKDLFGLSKKKKYRQFMNRGVSWHKRPGMSVAKFVQTHPKGTYFCHVTEHAFCIIDGVVHNQSTLTQHITEYYYISAPFDAPKPLPVYASEAEEVAAGEGMELGSEQPDPAAALKKKYTPLSSTIVDRGSLCGLEIMEGHSI